MSDKVHGVCIVSQSVSDSRVVDHSAFEKTGGYRVKVAQKSSANFIFSRCGHVVAFDVFDVSDLMGEQSPALASVYDDRISKLGTTFKDAFAIIRMHQSNQNERKIFQAVSCRSSGKPVMIAIPPEIDLGMLVLKLTQGLVSAPAGNLLNQGESNMQAQGAIRKSLMSISHLHLSEYEASALCMLGSLQQIASSSVKDILDTTDLDVYRRVLISYAR